MPAYLIRSVGAAALTLGLVGLTVAAAPGSDAPAPQPELDRTTLTPDALRDAAAEALRLGHAQRAYAFSNALVARDQSDRTALLIHARAARDLGQYKEAKGAARLAWKHSETDEQKYASSMVMAQALSSAGQRSWAQLWLRRAVQHAPTDELESRAIRDFRYVRKRNPWQTYLSFSVAPNSNINNGSRESNIGNTAIQFSNGSRPLSGLEYTFGLNTRYRFRESETRLHEFTFSGKIYHYTLSSSSERQQEQDAQDALQQPIPQQLRIYEGKDFAYGYYEFGYSQRGKNFDHRGEYSLSTQIGQTWYDAQPYTQYLQLNGGQRYKLNNGHNLGVNLTLRHNDGLRTADTSEIRTSFSYGLATESGGYLRASLGLREVMSTHKIYVPSDEFTEVSLSTNYWFGKPILGASANIGLSFRQRTYDDISNTQSSVQANYRKDDSLALDLTLKFKEVDYYGFNPTMTVSAASTNSNISRYKVDRFGINFGIQSAF